MSDDPIRHRALADNLAARLRVCSIAEQQLIDRALGSLEGVRERDVFGRRWERRIATGPGDVDRSWHLVSRFDHGVRRHIATTACNGSWMRDDPTETVDSPPLEERCTACWREAVQGDALGLALIDAWGELAAEERAKEGLREAVREEMVPSRPIERDDIRSNHFAHCTYDEDNGFCKRDGFGIESHCAECYEAARRPLAASDLQAAAKARVDRERRTVKRETISIGNVPGDGAEPMPLGPYPLVPLRTPLVAVGAINLMDAPPALKAKALDSMEQECRRLTVESESDRTIVDEFELEQHLTPGDAEEPAGVQAPDFEGGAG